MEPQESFSMPPEWLDLAPDETLEIEISGASAARNQLELGKELQRLPGVEIHMVGRKAFDISQLIYLAGAVGGIVQGIDVVARWLKDKREKQENVHITIRTAKGKVGLNADNTAAARELASKLKDATKKKR